MRFLYLVGGNQNQQGGATLRDASLVHGLCEAGHQVDAVSIFGRDGVPDENDVSGLFRPLEEKTLSSIMRWLRRSSSGTTNFLRNNLLSPKQAVSETQKKTLGRQTISLLSGSDGPRRREFERLIASLAAGEVKTDVAVFSNVMLSGLAKAIHNNLGCPVICLFQGGEEFIGALVEPYRSHVRRLIRKNAKQIDRVVTINKYSVLRAAETLALPTSRIRVAYLCVESISGWTGSRPRQPYAIGCLTSNRHENGLDILLDAVEALDKSHPHLRLELRVLGGTGGSSENRLGSRRLLRHMGNSSLGSRLKRVIGVSADERRKFMEGLSVFVIPDREDDIDGIYALEAMSSGIPIIGPETETLKEIYSRAAGGIMLPMNLVPRMITQALEYLAERPEVADELGKSGLEGVAKHFSRQKSAHKLVRIAEDLLTDGESA